MEIKKVSNGSISGYETKNIETTKSEPKSPSLGVGSAVSTFENVGIQQGTRDLGLEQSQIAGNFDIEKSPTGTETTDNRSKYENRPGNPFSKADDKSSDPIADRKNGAVDPSGPTGPDYAAIVEQGINREIPSGDKYAEYGGRGRTKEDLRKGASGQLLMDEASQNQQQQTNKYGKDGVSQSGGAGYGNVVGYDESEGVKGGSGDAAKNNPALNRFVEETFVKGGSTSVRAEMLKASEDDGTEKGKVGKDGTKIEENSNSTTVTKPDGSSTTVYSDGSYVDKDASGKVTGKGGSLTQYDQDYVPIENRLDFLKMSPGAIRPRTGSQGGDIDPAEDALPKGTAVDNTYLERLALRNNVAQPANPEGAYGGHPIGSSPNSGGDIDHGPDSLETGYSGASRGGDPTDLDVTVGGAPIKSSEDDSEDEEEQKKTKTKRTTPFMLRA
jgi:hypothetical protein